MKAWQYERPTSCGAIVELLAGGDRKVSLLAGGTDLLAQIRAGLIRPDLVVDTKGVGELQDLARGPDGLTIGAAVILNRLLEQRETTSNGGYAALLSAVSELASYPIRNRATLVGNVTNASPCADTVPPLCVLGASVEILGPGGRRRMPVAEFITGNRETKLQVGELVTAVTVPALAAGSWSGFRKRKRVKGHDLALANAALLRDPERKQLRLAVGSCSPAPVVVELDGMFERPDATEAARLAQEQIRPIDDVRASIEYRREMVGLMVRQLFAEMAEVAR